MLTRRNEKATTSKRHPGAVLKVTLTLLIVAGGRFVVPVRAFAQGYDVADTSSTEIVGTVQDTNGDPIPNATVVLQRPPVDPVKATTTEDGSFAVRDLTPALEYHIVISADGFSDWSSSASVEPGKQKSLGEIKLRMLPMERTITVSYSSKEIAAQQLTAEENQRVLGFIPNIFVTYEPHPEPLTAKMKFHLAYKGVTHPTFFAFQALWAGVQQAGDMTDYRLGVRGYGERFGANLAGATSEALFTNAILPSLLHQDPRYFYRGSGTKASRAWHAVAAPFVCQGDNGKSQPNYSQLGGSLITAALSNTYYPASDRGPGAVFTNFGTSMGLHVALGLVQEFVLPRFTSRYKR
jgi:hypothetical protein